MLALLQSIADKLQEPCWLIALAVIGLALFVIRDARRGAEVEGDRALETIRIALNKEATHHD